MNYLRISRFFCLFWIPAAFTASGQSLSASFDSAVVETGQAIRLTLSVPDFAGKPESVDISDWSAKFPPENILGQSGWQRIGDYWQNEIRLIAFDADTLQLPPVRVGLPDGGTLNSNALDLVITATPAPEELSDMADIKNIHREPGRWTDYAQWYAILGGLLLLALTAYWLLARRGKPGALSRQVKLPPHELALRKLKALEDKRYWQQGMYPAYYAGLSYILREYFEYRFGFPALESVAEDILYQLQQKDFPVSLRRPLAEFLQRSDLAKFAQAVPAAEYHPQALEFVRSCIRAPTVQQPNSPTAPS